MMEKIELFDIQDVLWARFIRRMIVVGACIVGIELAILILVFL